MGIGIHRRAAAVVATDGLRGLVRRAAAKAYRFVTRRKRAAARENIDWAARAAAEHSARLATERAAEDWRACAVAERATREAIERANRAEEERAGAAREAAERLAVERAAHEEKERAVYAAQVARFDAETKRRGLSLEKWVEWYHTIDLGGGLVTPGDYDFREHLPDYPFPADMSGMTALDVGSATGFFAFELERRGADVTSVDLPSLNDWDMIWSDRQALAAKLQTCFWTDEERAQYPIQYIHRAFDFCHRMLNSRVKRVKSRIYDVTPEKLGREQFDFMFLGDILGHLFSPLAALNALAPLCRKEMLISLDLVDLPYSSLLYGGGETATSDGRSWFQPNWEAMRQMLRRVGFRRVEVVGQSHVFVRRLWQWMKRDIIRATK